MKKLFINEKDIIAAIKNEEKIKNRWDIKILLEKKCGDGRFIIQKLIDGLGFLRYDFMRVNSDRTSQSEEEPDGVLVFLDEGNMPFATDDEYKQKRNSYKKYMIKDNFHRLNIDHRLVNKTSYLRGTEILQIAENFFCCYNKVQDKRFDKITVNHVGQKQVIHWLLKNGFDFLENDERDLFEKIIKNPEKRAEQDYTTSYGDSIKNMIINMQNGEDKKTISENDLVIFQLQKDL